MTVRSNSLLLAVILRGAAAADTYTKIPLSDCKSHDVTPQPSCGSNRNLSVAVLEAAIQCSKVCRVARQPIYHGVEPRKRYYEIQTPIKIDTVSPCRCAGACKGRL